MDNISHTLISIGLGATVARKMSPQCRRYAIWTSVIAGNLPDADLVTSIFSRQSKLVYLLQHRGHTHTIPYALLMGLWVGWISWRLFNRRNDAVDATARTVLVLTGVVSSALHLFMDWWNLYGLHPFYPFNNRWYYGDAVFIVEPLIWMSLVPFCLRSAEKHRYKILTALIPIVAISLALVFKSYVVATLLFGWLLLAWYWEQKKPNQHPGFILCTAALCCFFIGSFAAKELARSRAALPEGAMFLDSGLSPTPGNPFCWKFHTASLDGEDYVVRSGVISHLPALIKPEDCFLGRGEGKSANLNPVALKEENIHLDGEYRIAKANLLDFVKNCEFAAFRIFARMPFIQTLASDTVFGDLRFDNEKGLGFAELVLNPAADCDGLNLPPWIPPRADLFFQ